MICVTVNYKAFSKLDQEVDRNTELNERIDAVTSENISLQEEIHYLKNDPATIERQAKKFGLLPSTNGSKNKVPVPAAR
ncbi:MAG: septum formation initiator family protein [Acidobacteria bacterium]|nr:septum formation initiator family protein [Acidobacteriota bacterium]